MQWVDVHLNGSLWKGLFTAAWWAKMRRILMRKGEHSPAFLSPPGHSWSLWRSLCPLFILAPRCLCFRGWRSRSISLYKTQIMTNLFATTLHAQYILQLNILNRVLVVMGKSQVISEIKWCQECELRKLGQIETDAAPISVGKSWNFPYE